MSIAWGGEIILCQLSQKLALHDGIKRLLFSSQEATLSLETPLVLIFQRLFILVYITHVTSHVTLIQGNVASFFSRFPWLQFLCEDDKRQGELHVPVPSVWGCGENGRSGTRSDRPYREKT